MKQLHVIHRIQFDPGATDNKRTEYVVTKVTNSTTPRPQDILTTEQLETYCESDSWNVTVT